MAIRISAEQLRAFKESFESPSFAAQETEYKRAVHLLLSRLCSHELIDTAQFPILLARLMAGTLEPSEVGLSDEQGAAVQVGLQAVSGGLYGALANLAGGRWGVPQLDWIPIAVDFGLGDDIQASFRMFLDEAPELGARVDAFRSQMESIQARLRDLGGFRPKWQVLKPSYQFVGLILGAYDPTQYTFYHAGNLKAAFDRLGATWPRMEGGKRYAAVCQLVQEAHAAFRQAGLPVRDLIDTQSLLFIYGDAVRHSPNGPTDDGDRAPQPDLWTSLAEEILWPVEKARQLLNLAVRGKPLLFSGPPGTGKTFVARALARAIAVDDDHIDVVQFHPSYAYEDFMEGIRPKIGKTDGAIQYDIQSGVFRQVAEEAGDDPENTYVLIIDEMNRANLPRVLGEVLYCVEYRGKDGEIRLPYSGETFSLPKNVLIIGTMNTADRSIALVDAALRRRFTELSFAPDPEVLRRWWTKQGHPDTGEEAAGRLEKLNAELANRLDAHRLIGHTYVMDPHIVEDGFEPVWEWQLKPVLEEHLYAHPDDIGQLRKVFLEG